MISGATALSFVLICLLGAMAPGPDFLVVTRSAILGGRKAGISAGLGIALGVFVWVVAIALGVAAILTASAIAFTVVKLIGAAYLVWLGVGMLRKARAADPHLPVAPAADSPRKMFGHAAAVTAMNPKSIGFFLAFVPQFIHADRAVLPQALILIATFVVLAACNALAYALLADRLRGSEPVIAEELIAVQGKPADIGGYYRPDEAKTAAVMRPSATFNAALELLPA